jgi:5-methylthioadenosine/S-adenosylhomocysteine deaminase
MSPSLVIRGGCVMTMDAHRTVHAPGVVVCDGSRILAVEKDSGQSFGSAETIDATGCVIMPGLVNAHTHLYGMFGRSLSFDQLFPEWLATQKGIIAQFTADDFALCIEAGLILNLRCGNTTILDNLGLPAKTGNEFYSAALEISKRYHVGYTLARGYADQLHSPEYMETPPVIEHTMRELIERFNGTADGRLRVSLSPLQPWTLSREGFKLTRKLADEYGVAIHMHTAESTDYARMLEKAFGSPSHIQPLIDGGCLGPDVQLLGCSYLEERDLAEVARTRTRVIFDPLSAMNIGLGAPPTLAVIGNGNPSAIATNGMASAGGQDLFRAMQNLIGHARLQKGGPQALGVQRVLDLATIEGAAALGLDGEVGSLEPGKRADIVCVDIEDTYCAPAIDVGATLVFSASGQNVRDVVANGRTLVRNKRLTVADEHDVMRRATARAKELVNGLK